MIHAVINICLAGSLGAALILYTDGFDEAFSSEESVAWNALLEGDSDGITVVAVDMTNYRELSERLSVRLNASISYSNN
jgi:hypothetical protein